jgi:hypothetical protein
MPPPEPDDAKEPVGLKSLNIFRVENLLDARAMIIPVASWATRSQNNESQSARFGMVGEQDTAALLVSLLSVQRRGWNAT